jgi:uncharacterized membrane protein
MTDDKDKLNQLLLKMESLMKRHEDFSREIQNLSIEINKLISPHPDQVSKTEKVIKETYGNEPVPDLQAEILLADNLKHEHQIIRAANTTAVNPNAQVPIPKSNLEKFIGENLINKIGIVITIIGVAIGAKYSIDNELISPLTRIVLGYLSGVGLLAIGMKLKQNYENYSAVLVSGAMAILYFITFAAYSFYQLIPQSFAFALMAIFTVFTVIAALNYNRQIIAHIGLVGAYAVPFLLSNDSGNASFLFSYMAILNIGILAIAFKKYWKALYYAAFVITWLIFMAWYFIYYYSAAYFSTALTFLTIFFITFYGIFLAYKLIQKEKFSQGDILFLLANSFIFYGLGYAILSFHEIWIETLGLFTLGNALVHFGVGALLYQYKLADRSLFFFVSGLVLVFITITIPVQLDGNWVTLLWAGEAALLFWIGRTKNVPVYEKLSYPLMLLAVFSIIHDWRTSYYIFYPETTAARFWPLLNIQFLSALLFIGAFAFIFKLHREGKYISEATPQQGIYKLMAFAIPAILLFTTYFAFRMEISNYWTQLFLESSLTIDVDNYTDYFINYDLDRFRSIWIINYSLLFVSLLSFANYKFWKNQSMGLVNLVLFLFFIAVFLTQGLYVLSELRDSFLSQSLAPYYHIGEFNIGIRYISYVFVAFSIFAFYKFVRSGIIRRDIKVLFDFVLHIAVLSILSSELINLLEINNFTQSYKLGLSILWGIYALFLIALGIQTKKKLLRMGAIMLFGVTLVKLFFYDISHLDTIGKTVVFVSLGVLLLIISFLYNKYNLLISEDAEK